MPLDQYGKRIDTTRGGLVALATVFVVSRLAYYAFGLRFDASPATYFIQIMDVELLRTDLLRTLLYTHSQPPLFNLAIGIALKLFPADSTGFQVTMGAGYALLGLVEAFALYLVATELGAGRRTALLVTAVHTILPTTLRYENWLLYSHPIAALMTLAAFLLHRALSTGRRAWAFAYFVSLAALSLTRLTMNWMWFAVCAGAVIAAARREERRRLTALALGPAILVLSLTVRHLALFGSATTGDVFLGGSLSLKLHRELSAEQRADLVARKRISPLFSTSILADIEVVKGLVPPLSPTGIPVADADRKSTGSVNFNNLHYRALSLLQFEEVRNVIHDYPLVYARSVGRAVLQSFAPAGTDPGLPRLVPGNFRQTPAPVLLLTMPFLLAFGLVRAVRSSEEGRAARVTFAFLVFNIVFLTAVTCAISYGDFSRYRFEVDSYYVVLLTVALSALVEGVRAEW
jgi:hypothetical protein